MPLISPSISKAILSTNEWQISGEFLGIVRMALTEKEAEEFNRLMDFAGQQEFWTEGTLQECAVKLNHLLIQEYQLSPLAAYRITQYWSYQLK